MSVLDAAGEYVTAERIDLGAFVSERLAFEAPKLLPGGSLLANGWNPALDQSRNLRGLVRSTSIAAILDPVAQSVIILGEYGGSRQFYGDGLPPTIQPASPEYHEAIGRDRIALGSSERPEIDVFALTGSKLYSLQLSTNPPRISRAMRDRLRRQAHQSSAAPAVLIDRVWSDVPIPERLPFFSGLLVDEEGQTWVRDPKLLRSDSPPWQIYDRTGAHVARLQLPAGFVPMWSDGIVVVGVWKDDLEVEYIRAYTIERQ